MSGKTDEKQMCYGDAPEKMAEAERERENGESLRE